VKLDAVVTRRKWTENEQAKTSLSLQFVTFNELSQMAEQTGRNAKEMRSSEHEGLFCHLQNSEHIISAHIGHALTLEQSKLKISVIQQRMMMMMMMLHQLRHGRQDNHTTNHARCALRRKAKQSVKAMSNHHLECVDTTTFCTMQPSGHPANGYGSSFTARHGHKGTWMRTDNKG
jgi:hypothetical protein